ncbi:hypothetical protein LX16_4288 [Stackebrandtia albiflava]|uniref:MYXO-CTERM domain-containing protein n=1 Tax=Stackebrandtia albiflava TaxID=406432 RepID=A0A562UR44_9ACTN|nr:hypothetical protein [Stackebrandtia albiflava]TWJ08068.1 hypothetical protein LX16_4288 [Stackebrandtia albiflava]
MDVTSMVLRVVAAGVVSVTAALAHVGVAGAAPAGVVEESGTPAVSDRPSGSLTSEPGQGVEWWWPAAALLVIAVAAVWLFLRRRAATRPVTSPPRPPEPRRPYRSTPPIYRPPER